MANATYIPTQKTFECGGRTFNQAEVDAFVILYGYCNTNGNWSVMQIQSGTTGYQVSGTYTLQCIKSNPVTSNIMSPIPLYGDTDIGPNAGAAGTNPVYIGDLGGASAGLGSVMKSTTTTVSRTEEYVDFQIPNGKYPAVLCKEGPGSVVFYGHL